jgi:hypothetical protein
MSCHVVSWCGVGFASISKKDEDQRAPVAVLCNSYRPEYYYFECYNLLRKATLTGVLVGAIIR